jgi:uncharacterized protein YbjT (DUF2867 family)
MSKLVITGATGRVGSVVARRVLEGGHSVTAVTRSLDRSASLQSIGASVAVETLANAEGLAAVLDGANGFFVLLPEPIDAPDFHAARRAVLQSIARAVSVSSVGRVVALSSLGAQFRDRMGPISDLHDFEHALKGAGKPLTILRAATFQDYVASLLETASSAGVYPNFQPDRDIAISMVAIRDVGEIAARILTEPAFDGVVDILGPSYSQRQVADILGKTVGRSLEIIDIPFEQHVAALCRAGLPQQFAEVLAELQQAIAARRIVPVGDRRETGTTSLDETLAHIRGLAEASRV